MAKIRFASPRTRTPESVSRAYRRALAGFLCLLLAGPLAASASESENVDPNQRYKDLGLFSRVLTLVRANYVEPVDESELLRSALHGLLLDLDPHSAFMEEEVYEEMQVDTKGEFFGLGIEITKHEDQSVEVVSPIEGTPADRAGIKARDRIVAICPTEVPEDWEEPCRPTKNMSLFEAVNLMRGRRGTAITIEIMREGYARPRRFEIVRDAVKVASVDGRILEPGYAYVRIRSFQERTGREVEELIRTLSEESSPEGFRGMVLDLRDNPGGLLDQAVRVADVWLDDGLVVYTQGRDDSRRQEYRARPDALDGAYPLVVLVNDGTASASEIVAGAVQDQHRGLILGARTFGKGSVQTVYPLEGGSGLRLTTALYYTPSGRSIQEVGIEPDIEVHADLEGGAVAKRLERRRLREKDLEGHFRNRSGASEDVPEPEEDSVPDAQLDRAMEVLKSWDYFDRLRKSPDEKSVALETSTGEDS